MDLNAPLKNDGKKDERQRLDKIGKLVDQIRILCDQPTQDEMNAKGGTNFRRPVKERVQSP